VVSGFIFLRLLCPAILNPRQFNLISGTNFKVNDKNKLTSSFCRTTTSNGQQILDNGGQMSAKFSQLG